ncbi:hypothetical protein [Streptomyces sp. NPDC050848]
MPEWDELRETVASCGPLMEDPLLRKGAGLLLDALDDLAAALATRT